MEEKTYQVRRSISLPLDLDDRLTRLAELRHGGKRSQAVQELLRRGVTKSGEVVPGLTTNGGRPDLT